MGFYKTSLTRYRLGTGATATIYPAWIRIETPAGGAPQIITRDAAQLGVTAMGECYRSTDLMVGDLLYWSAEMRWFQVLQLLPQTASQQFFLSELALPLPDEFSYGSAIEAFWSATASGWTIDLATFSATLTLVGTWTYPSSGKQLRQSVPGDFDIYASLRVDSGSGTRYALLGGCNSAFTRGVFVGVRDNGSTVNYCRVDQYGDTSVAVVATAVYNLGAGNYGWVRLKRSGQGLLTYYSVSEDGVALDEPTTESDWAQIQPTAPNYYTHSGTVYVGPCGYGAAGAMRVDWIRNWV